MSHASLMERSFSADAPAWALNLPSGPATLVLILLLTLVLALWLREFIWAWYGTTCVAMLGYQACANGHAVLGLWSPHLSWMLPAMALVLVCAHVSVIVFFLRCIPRPHVSSAGRAGVIAIASLNVLGFLLVWLLDVQSGISWLTVFGFLQPFVLMLAMADRIFSGWRRSDEKLADAQSRNTRLRHELDELKVAFGRLKARQFVRKRGFLSRMFGRGGVKDDRHA